MPEAGEQVLWRAYVPRWSYEPLSGEGAARFGGRWNRIGQPALYAACELSTAWAEYNQGFVQHPALVLQLKLTGARLVDLTAPAVLESYGLDPALHSCEWRALVAQGETPPTYTLSDRLLDLGAHGVIYPSFMSRGGRCVALWRWNSKDAPKLEAIDPEGRLPRTAASWSEPRPK